MRVSSSRKQDRGTNPYLPPECPFHWEPPEERLQKRRSAITRCSDPVRPLPDGHLGGRNLRLRIRWSK